MMSTEKAAPQQCVFINQNATTPPPLPSNEGSTRALSRRNRVYVYRDFLLSKLPPPSTTSPNAPCNNILDVAGGRGDLSWLLHNVDGLTSTIADPRLPNHKSLIKSTEFLLDHPEEAAVRAVEGRPTHQPLAKLLPRLIENCGRGRDEKVCLSIPCHLRIHVDDRLVQTVKRVFCDNERSEDKRMSVWNEYWQQERLRIEPNNTEIHPQQDQKQHITNSRKAYETIRSLDYIAGFHPDQATEAAIDLALFLKIPWSVVPCCVFPKEFPSRQIDGSRVKSHSQLIDYLCRKHERIRKGVLPFVETATAKNIVLFMLSEDYD